MKKIYDCFCFFNELDILELRLNILDPYVDYFVLSEASVTHTGQPKPFYFEENKERYSKFLHKIIHLKITDTPDQFLTRPSIDPNTSFDNKCLYSIYNFIETQTKRFNRNTDQHYGRDFFQKECVRRGLQNCNDNDYIIFSDCDEIPNPDILKNLDNLNFKFLSLQQTTYYYYLNLIKEYNWKGSKIGRFSDLKNYSYNELRAEDHTLIDNGGWHFSYMGGIEQVKTKIKSFSAQEMNSKHVIDSVENNIINNIDPFFRSTLTKVEIDNTYPEYFLQNIDKYQHMIK